MTNKYMYFVANWKMFGDLRSLNSLDKVIKFSKNNKKNKLKIVYCPPNTLIRPLSRRLKKTKRIRMEKNWRIFSDGFCCFRFHLWWFWWRV